MNEKFNGLERNDTENNPKFSISESDGFEVLNNLEITEKNQVFAEKMAEIELELKARPYLRHDNNKIISTFEGIKEEMRRRTEEMLTNPSKYVNGAIISGLLACGLSIDFLNSQLLAEASADLIKNVSYGNPDAWVKTFDVMNVTEIVAAVGLLAISIKKGIKALSQTIKTRLAVNQRMQRYIAMLVVGANEKQAFKIVDTEVGEDNIIRSESVSQMEKRLQKDYGLSFNEIQTIRKELDEMGIKRISNEEYSDTKLI